jgi:alpha-tubulin suppressor-like RCC1 family protein
VDYTEIQLPASAGGRVLFKPCLENWVGVYCGNETTIALQKDGTLWAWGNFSHFKGALGRTTFSRPVPFCSESNWISLDANGVARNKAGQLWDVSDSMPNPHAGASAVFTLVSSNGALERVDSAPTLRLNWVKLWKHGATGFGLTADGMVWTWGMELGKEPVKTYESRLELLRDRLTGRAVPTASKKSSFYSSQPRPLLKLVGAKENPRRQ